MRLPLFGSASVVVACSACSLMLGDGFSEEGAPPEGASAEAGTSSDASRGSPDGGSSSGGPAPPNGRLLTFEDGELVHAATGADELVGDPFLAAGASSLVGAYSLGVNGNAAYVAVGLAPTADLYLSMYVRTNRETEAQIVRVPFDRPNAFIELRTEGSEVVGAVHSGSSSASFGRAKLEPGTSTLVGVHYHAGAVMGEVALYSSTGSGPLDRAGATASSDLRATLWRVEVGAIGGGAADATFDDVRVDTQSFGR